MRNAITARLASYRRRAVVRAQWDSPVSGTDTHAWALSEATSREYGGARLRRISRRSATVPATVGGRAKRCFDMGAAATAIVFLLPLFLLIALAIKLADYGPVLYRHRRIGKDGAPFDCLKFRTMVRDADEVLRRHLGSDCDAAREWEEKRKLTCDPRVTALGAVLRKSSLDELPQLLNVLKGEMSLVGPRPIVSAEVPKYGDCIGHYLRARPGLTGPWQVSGRNDVDYQSRVWLDRQYVENWNFRRDLLIIVSTIRVVVTSRGCY